MDYQMRLGTSMNTDHHHYGLEALRLETDHIPEDESGLSELKIHSFFSSSVIYLFSSPLGECLSWEAVEVELPVQEENTSHLGQPQRPQRPGMSLKW